MDLNAGLKMTDSGALQSRKRLHSPSCSSDEEEPTLALFPPEIWEAVFHHLTGLQLLRMRLVCHRWRDIITGCPPLMAQFKIVLENMEKMGFSFRGYPLEVFEHIDEDFRPDGLLPVAELLIKNYPIDVVDSWWPEIGQRLTVLSLDYCDIKVALLSSMLNQAPNLRCLRLERLMLDGTVEDFSIRLENVQDLFLHNVLFGKDEEYELFLGALGRLFPRLRDLCILGSQSENPHNLLQSLRALNGTLEGFEQDVPVIDVANDLSEFQLKRVSIHIDRGFNWKCWFKFFQLQPLIEELAVYSNHVNCCQILSDIGQAVPQLKRLTLYLSLDYPISEQTVFLKFMPNLENLKMCGKHHVETTLLCSGNPRLKKLYLSKFYIDSGFLQYLENSPHVLCVVLSDCYLGKEMPNDVTFSQLRVFEFNDFTCVALDTLKVLFALCPLLEELKFGSAQENSDELVRLTCERLKRLRKLTFVLGRLTDACVDHIVRYGLALEELRVGRFCLSEEAIGRIEATRKTRVFIARF